MRCPKCQYISFGSASRCKNCGYDFSLSLDAPAVDLPIQRAEEPIGPMKDLPLGRQGAPKADEWAVDAARRPGGMSESARGTVASRIDLPLFAGGPSHDDAPLVTPPAVPRAPLAVRRASPAAPRVGPRPPVLPEEAELLQQPSSEDAVELFPFEEPPTRRRVEPARDTSPRDEPAAAPVDVAPVTLRALAGTIDLLLAGGIDAAVVYFTLQLCGLTLAEIGVLPKVPLIAFLLLVNGGYFVLFTAAGGQTIGQMAAGLRVVMQPDHEVPRGRVSFTAALWRAVFYLLALLPAGAGLLPVLVTADGRALHDRLSDTRVVRA